MFKQYIYPALKEIFQTIFVSLVIFYFVYIFLVQPHRVKGESMLPNFLDGELLLTEKVSYYLDDPKRGDVIVFAAPIGRKVDFIKRIVGLPGDEVEIIDGEVHINGEKINEPYETQKTQGTVKMTVGEGQYFVMGDNRVASSDSRIFGTIDRKSIKGRAWVVYWPLLKTNGFDGPRVISRVN